jgi:DNA-binding response OmpR family regulator
MPKTVLVADDSTTIRRVVELTFSDTDIRVEAVASGREALECLAAVKPDLVLADVAMPGSSGYELCRAVKRSAHPVPVLLLAGTFESFDVKRAVECGADDHLVKPFQSRALIDKVETLLAGSQPSAPQGTTRDAFPAAPVPMVEPATVRPPVTSDASGRDETTGCVLSPAELEAVARAVAARITTDTVREIAREVLPDLAEAILRRRLRELGE